MQPSVLTRKTPRSETSGAKDSPTTNPRRKRTPMSIDMFTPYQACTRLGVSPAALLDLVNAGDLPAYDFGDAIRFRVSEVESLAIEAFQQASTSSGIRR